MIEVSITEIIFCLSAGMLLGVIFFGGLWFTANRLAISNHPALLMAGSLLLRFGLVLIAFHWLLTAVHWQALLFSLLGFIFVRPLILRWGTAG